MARLPMVAQSTTLTYNPGSTVKLEQVIGDCDYQAQAVEIVAGQPLTCVPTTSKTVTRADVAGNGQGGSFEAGGRMIFFFGDTISSNPSVVNYHAGDPIAWSTSTDPEAGLLLNFYKQSSGLPLFVKPPGIAMGGDDIPNSGITLNGQIYFIVNTGSDTTSANPQLTDYSALVSFDEAAQTFTAGRTISPAGGRFIGTSMHASGSNVFIFGAGPYRASDIYLQMVPASSFVSGAGTQYFAGFVNGQPNWTNTEAGAVPVVQDNPTNGPAWPNDNPSVGNLSVVYSSALGLWLMTYDGGRNASGPGHTGTYFTYAAQPWGPWATPQLIMNDRRDHALGLGGFVHDPSIIPDPPGDGLNGPMIGSNNVYTSPGGAFAPQIIERFVTVTGNTLKLYYNLSTWNPYVIVRMRSEFTISGCQYSLNQGGQAFTAAGGSGTVTITTTPGCPWSVTNLPPWVTLTGPSSGTGSAMINFQVSPASGGGLFGSFMIGGLIFTVEQQTPSIAGLNSIGSMPHLAAEENWTTAFTLVNKSNAMAQARLSFFGDDSAYSSDPNGSGPLLLALAFPQQPAAAGPLLAASFDQTLAANASLIASTAGSQTPPVQVGSAQLAATGAVDGFAIFHQVVTQQEAVVPLETRNASSYLLPFDNTNGLVLGVALANISGQAATVQVVIRDDTGTQIATGSLPQLAVGDHYQFGLAAQFPITANKRGTIEFDTPAGGRISVLGLRFTPPNNALTTIPVLANVGTNGGSIAQLASGGDGWQTTFVLVNTGTSSAQATMSFFADQTGAPMLMPLTFPQGNIAATTASSVTQTLLPGATLLIVSSGAPNLLTGSAQLSTTGNVSGFVIFRHNDQEAVVPLESRNASAYIIAFDNTKGTATGIAVNAVSTQQVSVPVIVRDDTGTQIATDTLNLAANGHTQFTLVTDKYPLTTNSRGTIEFDTPAGAQIGALGIRIPSGAAHTYTTLPALAK
ncbi:MAG TPA: DUF4185 domain-containing protein [Bryobacteraceae bacterium]|nr:DUF4185 domain-containing protein [Bryobacteraceae bacterium]